MKPAFKQKTDFGDPALRKAYLSRYQYCQVCKVIKANEVHHVIPARSNKKIETYGNYLSVCRLCHNELEAMNWWTRVKRGLEIKFTSIQGLSQ